MMKNTGFSYLLGVFFMAVSISSAVAQETFISKVSKKGYFPLVSEAGPATVYVDRNDHAGVQRVAQDFVKDVERVTGKIPILESTTEDFFWHSCDYWNTWKECSY
jgi:hypothetical protein